MSAQPRLEASAAQGDARLPRPDRIPRLVSIRSRRLPVASSGMEQKLRKTPWEQRVSSLGTGVLPLTSASQALSAECCGYIRSV